MEDKLVYTTDTGIKLYTSELTKTANQYAKSLRLRNIKIFIAEDTYSIKNFVIFSNGKPIYETRYYEQIGTRLTAIKMARKVKR